MSFTFGLFKLLCPYLLEVTCPKAIFQVQFTMMVSGTCPHPDFQDLRR
jgi:hypothetical protein